MSEDPQAFLLQVVVALICVLGGFRFRRWAVAGRDRIPRFSQTMETIVCWSVYSFSCRSVCSGVATGCSTTTNSRFSSPSPIIGWSFAVFGRAPRLSF